MSTPLILRRATPADAPAIFALTRAAYAKWVKRIGREPLPMTADYDKAVAEHLIDLYEENGEIRALIEMIPETDHLLIENIAVHPDLHGQGIGERLLTHADATALSLGLAETRLYTNIAMVSNIAFYKKRGYETTHEETVAPGITRVWMRKSLR
jgi:N-acetylglutamate synthase-like GNAT family acetyltransferase